MIKRLEAKLQFSCVSNVSALKTSMTLLQIPCMAKISGFRLPFGNFSTAAQTTAVNKLQNEQSINDYVCSLYKQKLFKEALEAFDLLYKQATIATIYASTYARLATACSSIKSLKYAKKIHNHILASKIQPDVVLQNHVLNMCGKCGLLEDAREVFDQMEGRNVVSWTSMIEGYSQNGQAIESMDLYFEMRKCGLKPDHFTLGSAVKACSSLGDVDLGRHLHAHNIKSEFGSHIIPQNALITMYTKFGQMHEALQVFNSIKSKDLISWSSVIAGSSQLGYEIEALDYFKAMISQGCHKLNEFIFGSVFSACGSLVQPEYGRQLHGMSVKFGLGRDTFSGCSLTDMYAKCTLLQSARIAFLQIESPDLVSWNAIIAGFSYGGNSNEALMLFSYMRHLGFTPDDITVRSLLCAFTRPSDLFQGMQLHSYIVKMGSNTDIPVCNTLLSMYANCLNSVDAHRLFDEIQSKADVVSWNAILTVCMQQNQAGEIFSLFKMMLLSHSKPNHITLATVMGACGKVASLEIGDQMHCYLIKIGLEQDVSVMNGLIDMYLKCGSLNTAQKLFNCMENPDVVSWSSLILGYAQFGYGEEALNRFRNMRNLGIKPNEVTFVGVLTACSHVGLVEEGWQMFNSMEREHGITPTREHCSCVTDLLARAGHINEAEAFINQMAFDPDIVMWKSLLAACRTHNNIKVAKRAAENILKIDPSNSAAHVLLCSMYATAGCWKDFAYLRSLMKQKGIKKVPGQSWIEIKDKVHVFLAEDCMHPEKDKIYSLLEELLLQMLDAGYVILRREASLGNCSSKILELRN